MSKQFTIGQAAKVTGLSTKTIRFYEEAGMFKPLKRGNNKYRIFLEGDIKRLHLIKNIRSLGIPLTEVKKIVARCMDQGCKQAEAYAEAKLPEYIATVDQKIKELIDLKQQLMFIKDNFKKYPLRSRVVDGGKKKGD